MLNDLFSLSDRVQQYAGEVNGVKTCHGCGRKSETLKACGRCTMFWYCDKACGSTSRAHDLTVLTLSDDQACQTSAWGDKGHKGDCKLLKDPDLRGLLLLPRDGFTKHHGFSVS